MESLHKDSGMITQPSSDTSKWIKLEILDSSVYPPRKLLGDYDYLSIGFMSRPKICL